MKPTWIMVANASRAVCLAREDTTSAATLLFSMDHPQSRARDRDLTVSGLGHGRGAATYVPRLDPKAKEHDQFAQQLADRLSAGVAAHSCGELILIASKSMLGEIRNRLDKQAAKAVSASVAADLTAYEGRELRERIDEALAKPA